MIKIANFKAELINTNDYDGQFNMDYDLDLVRQIKSGREPVFRIYSWDPWCLSLGANQNIDIINHSELEKSNYDWVRRPTGGNAVLHSNELTYSFVCQIDSSPREIYKEINQFWQKVFSNIGFSTELEEKANEIIIHRNQSYNDACFATSAKSELQSSNRKLIGSAQKIIDRKYLLQHGSIPLDNSFLDIFNYLIIDDSEKEKSIQYLKEHSISLEEALGRKISFSEFATEIEKYDI